MHNSRIAFALVATLVATSPVTPAAAEESPAATFRGRPISRADLHRALATRVLRLDAGERLRDQFLSDRVAGMERDRRRIVISDAELDEAVERTGRQALEQMRRHGEGNASTTFEDILKERGATLADFKRKTREYLALQKMAAVDLGAPGEVTPAQVDLWLRELKMRAGIVVEGILPSSGNVATMKGQPVSQEEFGRWLTLQIPRHEIAAAIRTLAFDVAVRMRAEEKSVALPPEAPAEEVARLEKEFMDQPGIAESGVDFESWLLRAQGLTRDGLMRDTGFRTKLLASRVLDAEVTAEEVAKEYEDNAGLYGESARVRRILVRGMRTETTLGRGKRTLVEARRLVDRAIDLLESGKAFTEVARSMSDDPEAARGVPFDVTPQMQSTMLPSEVLDAVFRTPAGKYTEPVETPDGYYIIEVIRRTPAPSREEALPRVRAELIARRIGLWRLDTGSDTALVIAADLM